MHTPTLRQLQQLVYLAEERHFARAAQRAHVTQSALSRSLQTLEDAAGMRLFDRSSRSVEITAVGERLVARARSLLSGADDLGREIRLLRSGDAGQVTVGVGAFTGLTLLPDAMARLYSEHPSVRIKLVQDNWRMLMEVLQQGKLDFFLAHITEIRADDSLDVEPLGSLPGHFYCRPTHPLAGRRELSARDLAGQHFASVALPPEFSRRLDDLIAAPGGRGFDVALESENAGLLVQMAFRSDIVLVAGDAVLTHELASGQLVRLNVAELKEPRASDLLLAQFGILRLKGRTLSPAALMLMDMVRAQAARTLTGPRRPPAPRAARNMQRPRPPSRKKAPPSRREHSRGKV
ncbi:LysR family transcriptional regulator [Bradyrhizobium sp. 83002]|uniref:LysR family transcriptional regulator n=1 Tax=Bradyrhizobium aeschynomenes TaxID=2734909 RepID=UPI001553D56D|nr:LysR family transcriptional regulator [Bradyrhizobium aeschynomenes]NPU13758.1 LysR family transcriptional regulator [Bradyrhizobium aeschynomenes]